MRPSAGSIVTPNGSLPTLYVRSIEAASAPAGKAALRTKAKPKAAANRRIGPHYRDDHGRVGSKELASHLVRMAACACLRTSDSVHNALQPARARAAVRVHVADHSVRGAQREVVARRSALPPLRLHPPRAHALDDREAPTRDLQQRELPFVPYEACGDRIGE